MPDHDEPQDLDDETEFWRTGPGHHRDRSHDWSTDPDRIEALRIGCPHCHAPPATACRNHTTNTELQHLPCHPIRLTEARRTSR